MWIINYLLVSWLLNQSVFTVYKMNQHKSYINFDTLIWTYHLKEKPGFTEIVCSATLTLVTDGIPFSHFPLFQIGVKNEAFSI